LYNRRQSRKELKTSVYAVLIIAFSPKNKKYRSCAKVDFQSVCIYGVSYGWTFPTTQWKSISHSMILNTVSSHSSYSFVQVGIRSTCLSSLLSWALDRSRFPGYARLEGMSDGSLRVWEIWRVLAVYRTLHDFRFTFHVTILYLCCIACGCFVCLIVSYWE